MVVGVKELKDEVIMARYEKLTTIENAISPLAPVLTIFCFSSDICMDYSMPGFYFFLMRVAPIVPKRMISSSKTPAKIIPFVSLVASVKLWIASVGVGRGVLDAGLECTVGVAGGFVGCLLEVPIKKTIDRIKATIKRKTCQGKSRFFLVIAADVPIKVLSIERRLIGQPGRDRFQA